MSIAVVLIYFHINLILANVFFLYKNNFKKYLLINVVISIYILILFVILNLSINTDISAVKGICKSLENYIKPFSKKGSPTCTAGRSSKEEFVNSALAKLAPPIPSRPVVLPT